MSKAHRAKRRRSDPAVSPSAWTTELRHQCDAGPEVLRYTEIAPVPGAPSYVLGIINLRGNVVTVIDTRQRFGLDPAPVSDNTRIVIIEADKQVVGILVDSVAEVVYPGSSRKSRPRRTSATKSRPSSSRVSATRTAGLLILVELDKMMTEEEWSEPGQHLMRSTDTRAC
ncbi:chemotaxis protein CheW [Pseudomonas aeruginosa]